MATVAPNPAISTSTVKGTFTFQQASTNDATTITYDLTGNTPNSQRGVHIHASGNANCDAAGPHCTKTHGPITIHEHF